MPTAEELGFQFAALQALLDQFLGRSSSESPLELNAFAQASDNGALTVTFVEQPQPDEEWIISRLTLWGIALGNPPTNAQSPICGLFRVQNGAPIESLADGQASAGWNIESRGIPLPSGVNVGITTSDPAGTPSYIFSITLTQSTPIPVGPGSTLRGVVSCNPGTANPGPGTGSRVWMWAQGVRRRKVRDAL